MTLTREALANKPTRLRGPIARGLKAQGKAKLVDPEGGEYGAGLIRGAAVLTRGEARGHGLWVDRTMLEQTRDAIKAAESGVKSRFAHPGLSGDGLGKAIGRFQNARLSGEVVRADLHFFASAHNTPSGDLAGYLMGLAEEDPAAFGTSISFESDLSAEERFVADHADEDGAFESPDEDNVNNYPHARLAALRAVDAVDEPAANPSGLFHADNIAHQLDAVAEYAFGLTDVEPDAVEDLGLAPERIRGFVSRFLEAHGLEVIPADSSRKENHTMAKDAETAGVVLSATTVDDQVRQFAEQCPAAAQALRDEGAKTSLGRIVTFSEAFPDDPAFVLEHLRAGSTLEQAQAEREESRLAALEAQNVELRAQLEALKSAPVGAKPAGPAAREEAETETPENPKSEFDAAVDTYVEQHGVTREDAAYKVATANPKLWAHVRAQAFKAGAASKRNDD